MMQCPSCSAALVSGEARCTSCHALVNPPTHGNWALAPRLVTPQSIDGASPQKDSPQKSSPDEAWRREVLERVRKRRQVRTHALPLFVEGQGSDVSSLDVAIVEQLAGATSRPVRQDPPPPQDPVRPFDVPIAPAALAEADFDLPLRPAESDNASSQRAPSQSLVERPRPALVTGPTGTRSLVADLPLVEPTRTEAAPDELSSRVAAPSVNPRAATMNDRVQAAFIDLGLWSAMSVAAFYFASRIARTSILGLGPAWQGLVLFGLVLASAYILFFGGLSGATPGKIACGIQVRRYDGTSLGPLPSLARGFLGLLGVGLLGLGIWPAFWDKDRRALHDRATDSRVTTV